MIALATGEGLPDAYIGFGTSSIFSHSNLQKYGESGAVIPLDDLIEQYGENLKSVWDELGEYSIRQHMTSSDGHIYYMPGLSASLITRYIRQVMWVNKGWLEALDIAVPETTEEFRDMLHAFKTGDPNGNGLADEIPLAGTEDHYGKQVYDYLFNAFIYNKPKNDHFMLENGSVDYAPVRDEWRDALLYMHGLYQDGLLSPLSFTQNNQQHIQLANDPRDLLGAFTSPGITYTVLQNSPEILARYVGIGPLAGPDGKKNASVNVPLPNPYAVITSACEHPAEVFKLFDLMLSEEASLRGRYGEQGVDWELAGEGEISIYGTPATIRVINQLRNNPQNKHLNQIGPYISRPWFTNVTWDGSETDGEYMNAQAAMLYREHEPDEYIGELIFSGTEKEHILDIRTDIETYVRQSIIDFITGDRDIASDSEWAAYVREIENMGLSALLKTAQAAFERMKGG